VTAWTFDQLPANLPSGRRYVTWNMSPRGKVPTIPSSSTRHASVSDPLTWDTFETARASVEDGKADGLGLVLTGDLVVFDLDACVTATGELAADAAAVLTALPTYAERSPSMRGLHVPVFGTLPPGRRRRAGLEVYDRDRFITLTGWRWSDTPPLIIDQAAALTALYPHLFPTRDRPLSVFTDVPLTESDRELLEKAQRARNGVLFTALWHGNVSGFPSHSEADAALCRQLSFWTQRDPIRIDGLFRQSGLMRDKWDATRGRDTYGALTIAHAIATTPAVYRPPVNLLENLEVPMA
jgi:primase-polymerase (primpol)-like protein